MFGDSNLFSELNVSSSLTTESKVFAEWNMNIPSNFLSIGNYRYRQQESSSIYNLVPETFDRYDSGNYYTGATDADILIDGGLDDSNQALAFSSKQQLTNILFSLEECFGKFRPRSGINKAKIPYASNSYFHYANKDMAKRPRYYLASKNDKFKYWTSDRSEDGRLRGVSYPLTSGAYGIDDVAPFIVYNNPVPANRIVVKMQTHVGSDDKGIFYENNGSALLDPFYGYENSKTPTKWKIQYLEDNNWIDAVSFLPSDLRLNNTPIIAEDGTVEVYYGIKIPDKYVNIFNYKKTYISELMIPEKPDVGSSYLIKENESDAGVFYVYTDSGYETFAGTYGWSLLQNSVIDYRNSLEKASDPDYFVNGLTGKKEYSKFAYVSGLRIVVEQMNTGGSTFDLIELSPRLVADITDNVENISITKSASDLGNAGMPVGQLLASVGTLSLFDHNQAFNENNKNSVIGPYLDQVIKFSIYELMSGASGEPNLIPIKTMYSSEKPKVSAESRDILINLRDLMFLLETRLAPELLLADVSLSVAISTLLDSIGFTNYKFLRVPGEQDLIIPYFFISTEQSVLEVLQDLAVSSQSAMFFDEDNNLIIMSKNYMMPSPDQREVDLVLSGNKIGNEFANIEAISSQDSKVFNDGQISYSERYIQRSYGSIKQAMMQDRDKTWIYKPSLLWEASGTLNTKSQNSILASSSAYSLSAIPLNSSLSNLVPTVSNNQIVNNILDFGEGSYFISRYDGYFYANGEIINYDAVEYSIPDTVGNVWVQNTQEYSDYFQNVKFAKSIFPTGRVRIYSEPYYEVVDGVTRFKDGAVRVHGRGQFGTPIVSHDAGISSHWSDPTTNPTKGCKTPLADLIKSNPETATAASKAAVLGEAGLSNSTVLSATRNGVIKNALGGTARSETAIRLLKSPEIGTVQSSALVFNGPTFTSDLTASDYISYVPKKLNNSYSHFGTRLRLVGRYEDGKTKTQTPAGSMGYYDSGKIGGSSGGLAVLLNSENNNGYYLEVMALTNSESSEAGSELLSNVIFYKIKGNSAKNAVPIKLWSGAANILVDSGSFVGQSRVFGEENPTVYDLSIEYEDVGANTRRFYLYINNRCVSIVDDGDRLPVYNNMALFVRGTSKLMFENVFAITKKYSLDSRSSLGTPINSIFGDSEVDVSEAMRKYSMSGAVQKTYLSDIGSQQGPGYDMYFEEFGTIMREAAYFKIKYDKAYPALSAQIAPTFNKIKGYTVSGFLPGAYGAEFLIFNNTDTVISLDETTGNYLRILGVTFTQNSDRVLTLSDFFNENSDLSNVDRLDKNPLESPTRAKKQYFDIVSSRSTYGTNSFTINAKYIQNSDAAKELMGWLIDKTIKSRKSVGLSIFGGSVLQLGDIVKISMSDSSGTDLSVASDKRFVVYSISYSRDAEGPETIVYLSEVI
jgi:hypothetical protein